MKLFAAIAAILFSITATSYASDLDDSIVASAGNSYTFKTSLNGDDIKVRSNDGVVTLTGTVANTDHKLLAVNTINSLPGVKGVDDELEVTGSQPIEHSDEWLAMKVKTALLFHRDLSPATQVEVNDGAAILTGPANSQAQKELTTEYARDVEGVKRVENQMSVDEDAQIPAVDTSEKIDDASITAQVELTLLTHRSTNPFKTNVHTENGVVILTGNAGNPIEKELITKLVSDVNGVRTVLNNMDVE